MTIEHEYWYYFVHDSNYRCNKSAMDDHQAASSQPGGQSQRFIDWTSGPVFFLVGQNRPEMLSIQPLNSNSTR